MRVFKNPNQLIVVLIFIFSATSALFAGSNPDKYVAGEIVVTFKIGFTERDTARLFSKMGMGKALKNAPETFLVKLKKGLTIEAAVKIAEKDPSVQVAGPNIIFRAGPKPVTQKNQRR